MPRLKKLPVAFAFAASALTLAACATTTEGGTDSASTSSTSTSTSTPAPTPTNNGSRTPTPTAPAEVTVGGATMVATQTIVQNAAKASNLTVLVKAVQAAGLDATLSGAGPFTVFAPTDAAFNALPPGTVDTLLQPTSKPALTKILQHHVVSGKLDSAAIEGQIKAGGGTAQLSTMVGQPLTATVVNGNIELKSSGGSIGYVTQVDVPASNGVVHIINGVLVPKLGAAPAQTPPAQ